MGKWVAAGILDGALQAVTAADGMIAVEGQPTDFASAMGGKLAMTAMSQGDYTLGDGVAGGRRLFITAKTDVPVSAAGVADHIALVDTLGGELLYVTICPPRSLSAGGSVSFEAWTVEIGAPV
jgi:hypothetical protein